MAINDSDENIQISSDEDEEMSLTMPASQLYNTPKSIRSFNHFSKRGLSPCSNIEDPDEIRGSSSSILQKNKRNRVLESFLNRFRKGKGLSVTDLTGTEWCEKQKEFVLHFGKQKTTEAMKAGSARHEVLEKEVMKRVQVRADSSEDVWAIKFVNFIVGVNQLLFHGLTRELPLVGFIEGVWMVGVIDEIRMPASEPTKAPLLVDTKTRVTATLPAEAQKRNGRFQLMCYKYMWDTLVADKFPSQKFYEFFSLNPNSVLSPQIRDYTAESGVPSMTLSDVVRFFGISCCSLPQAHNQLLLRYELQKDESLLGEDEFAYDHDLVKDQMKSCLDFWQGKREASYPPMEELWKCKFCSFASKCSVNSNPDDSPSNARREDIPSPKNMGKNTNRNRRLDFGDHDKLEVIDLDQDEDGETSHDLLVRQVGGINNLDFIPDDYRNYLRTKRTREMQKGDTGGVLEYLHKMQIDDPNFFYAIQVDQEDLITNIFWSDAKMMNDYSDFGDVVSFDTTYKKNSEDRPLALFVGINHHKQTVVFGVALLYDETTPTFEWLFDTFAKAMSEKKPIPILTDQDHAMKKALKSKWSETHHRLCIWHIYQNAAIHLSGVFTKFKSFACDFDSCVYDFEEEEDFLSAWNGMLQKYELEDNNWLKRLFAIKEQWALVYGRQMFCADMTTTQRSESMNSVVKRYASYKHNFLQFFNHFQRLIDDGRYRELKTDFVANTSTPALVSPVEILKHAANIYTPKVFKCFQDQWNRSHDCSFEVCEGEGTITKYKITPVGKRDSHIVTQDSSNYKFKCSCSKFEFAGILCAHVLKVFTFKSVFKIPNQYILKRWTRKAKTGYLDTRGLGANESEDNEASSRMRYRDLSALTLRLATRAAERKDISKIVKEHLLDLLEKIDEMLQGKEVVPSTETNILEHNVIELTVNDKIKGVRLMTKPTSSKRLKSCIE